jgi:hypothetical protein
LAEHDRRVHPRLEHFRPDIEDQDAVVAAVAHEQTLISIVYRYGRTAAYVVGGEADRLRVRIGLAENRDDRSPCADAVRMDVEDHDLAAGVGVSSSRGVVDDEQPLVDMIDTYRSGELRFALRPVVGM